MSATRVASNALGALLTSRNAANLSPLASGCLVALVQYLVGRDAFESLGSTTTLKDAHTILSMKGLSVPDSEIAVSVLVMSGLVRVDLQDLRIPLLDHALRGESAILANRVAGWRKRDATATPKPRPALVLLEVVQAADASVIVAPIVAEPDSAPAPASTLAIVSVLAAPVGKVQNSPTKRILSTGGRRYSVSDNEPTDPSVDPVLVRVLCENGQFAELTAQYVEHLQQTFKMVDALVQLKHAALWCESNPKKRKTFNGMRKFLTMWMGSAAREADVRSAVVRVGNQKNGFGQGADYAAAQTTQVAVQGAQPLADDATDDFLDLAPATSGLATVAAPFAASIVAAASPSKLPDAAPFDLRPVQSSAVLAARANASAARTAAAARAGQTRQTRQEMSRGNFFSQSQR